MKTLKNKYLVVFLVIFSITVTTLYGKEFYLSSKQYFSASQPSERLLGKWALEGSPSDTIEFLNNGIVRRFEDNILQESFNYQVSSTCNNQSSSDGLLYLKYIFQEGDSICLTILNGIYADNENTLTLLTLNQGKIIVYKKL